MRRDLGVVARGRALGQRTSQTSRFAVQGMKLLRTLAVAYLYYPHLWLLRGIGPYGAVLLGRVIAWFHWLATFCGADRQTRLAMQAARPQLEVAASVASILRRHLAIKHQNFCEWYLYPTARGRRYVERTYQSLDGIEHLDGARAQGRGVILLVFHFGMVKMAFPALHAHGYTVHQHVFRGQTYAGQTYGWMARAAMQRLARMEQSIDLPVIYHRPLAALITLLRYLRRGEIVSLNGDGMMGENFVQVPFLGGTISLPTGPAELAVRSGAPIVPVFVFLEGLFRHRVVLHKPIYATGDDRRSIAAAVADYTALLEQHVRRQPWAWWTWRRLRVTRHPDGQVHYHIQALAGPASAAARDPVGSDVPRPPSLIAS